MTFELKLFIKEPEKTKSMVRHFEPKNVENKLEHYEYFKDKKGILRILKNSNGKLTYIVCALTKDKKGFKFIEKAIKSWSRMFSNLKRECKHEVSFTKETTEYILRDIKVRFCKIENLGTYMEIETDSGGEKRLLDFLHNFELTEKDIINVPYNEIIIRKNIKKLIPAAAK